MRALVGRAGTEKSDNRYCRLLRARRERPRRRTAEQCDKLASPHVQHRAFLLPAITIAGDGSGRSVYRILTRHPAVSAAAIASLDHISNGRAVLGIGAGHSGTKNVGLSKSRAKDLAEGVVFIKALLRGKPAGLGTATAHLPWIKRAPPVFLAASHPPTLRAAGQTADGVFSNFG